MVVVLTELAADCLLNEMLYADDLLLINETIEGSKRKSSEWRETL